MKKVMFAYIVMSAKTFICNDLMLAENHQTFIFPNGLTCLVDEYNVSQNQLFPMSLYVLKMIFIKRTARTSK